MSQKTGIEWTEATWNPVVGCTKVSEGCRNCYAKALHDRRHKAYLAGKHMPPQYAQPFGVIQLLEERLKLPLHWRKPRKIFVDSGSDLFHEKVDDHFINELFETMRAANWHTFQVLTKRPERAVAWFEQYARSFAGWSEPWPTNVWMGVSVEDQPAANERIPHLLKLPAWVRFLSCEPLLGPVDLTRVHDKVNSVYYDVLDARRFDYGSDGFGVAAPMAARIKWVIVGGESGPEARPMHPTWARALRDQSQATKVDFYFKQWGEWGWVPKGVPIFNSRVTHLGEETFVHFGKKYMGAELDGKEWKQMPANYPTGLISTQKGV